MGIFTASHQNHLRIKGDCKVNERKEKERLGGRKKNKRGREIECVCERERKMKREKTKERGS